MLSSYRLPGHRSIWHLPPNDLDNGRRKVQGLSYVYLYTHAAWLAGWLVGWHLPDLKIKGKCDRNKINIATPIYTYMIYTHRKYRTRALTHTQIAHFPCQDMCSKSTYNKREKKNTVYCVRFIVTTCAVYFLIWPNHFRLRLQRLFAMVIVMYLFSVYAAIVYKRNRRIRVVASARCFSSLSSFMLWAAQQFTIALVKMYRVKKKVHDFRLDCDIERRQQRRRGRRSMVTRVACMIPCWRWNDWNKTKTTTTTTTGNRTTRKNKKSAGRMEKKMVGFA